MVKILRVDFQKENKTILEPWNFNMGYPISVQKKKNK